MTRKIYTNSTLDIDGISFFVRSVSYNESFPRETIEQFGEEYFLLAQNDPNIYSLEFTFYPTGGEGAFFENLKTQTLNASPTRSTVSSSLGSLRNALLTSLRGEASIGSVPTMSVKFIGASGSILPIASPSSSPLASIKTTENIKLNGADCAQKVSFSWEIPVIAVLPHSESLNDPESFFGDLPGKFNIDVEQAGSMGSNVTSVNFGGFGIAFSGTKVSSVTNLSVGALFQTFSYSLDGAPEKVTFS